MAKIKLTNNQLQATTNKVIRVGYCGCQTLLNGLNAYAYNSGVYGWNWDAYDIGGGVTVCTGYRNLTGESVQYSDLEEKAIKILDSENYKKFGYDWQINELQKLRNELAQRARG